MAVIIDVPGWAFHICGKIIKKELKNIVDVDIYTFPFKQPSGDLFLLLEQLKDYDYIHFMWRENLLQFNSKEFKEKVKNANYDYEEYLNFVVPKISTIVCDHLFLDEKNIDKYKDVFNLYCSDYYVFTDKLNEIYCNIPSYKKPKMVILDTYDKTYFKPLNLERFNEIENRPLVIGWVGNSDWNNDGGDNIDFKGFHQILNPVLDELISEGYNLKKHFADRNQNYDEKKIIPNEEMLNYYKEIDLYITCSYIEGTPRPVLEAMACGVPVIATDVGLVPEVFGDLQKEYIIGDRAKISEKQIKKNLKDSIIKLYDNRILLKYLSDENIKQSKKLHSSNYKKDYIQFFGLKTEAMKVPFRKFSKKIKEKIPLPKLYENNNLDNEKESSVQTHNPNVWEKTSSIEDLEKKESLLIIKKDNVSSEEFFYLKELTLSGDFEITMDIKSENGTFISYMLNTNLNFDSSKAFGWRNITQWTSLRINRTNNKVKIYFNYSLEPQKVFENSLDNLFFIIRFTGFKKENILFLKNFKIVNEKNEIIFSDFYDENDDFIKFKKVEELS